jgi:hypothetical protein
MKVLERPMVALAPGNRANSPRVIGVRPDSTRAQPPTSRARRYYAFALPDLVWLAIGRAFLQRPAVRLRQARSAPPEPKQSGSPTTRLQVHLATEGSARTPVDQAVTGPIAAWSPPERGDYWSQ